MTGFRWRLVDLDDSLGDLVTTVESRWRHDDETDCLIDAHDYLVAYATDDPGDSTHVLQVWDDTTGRFTLQIEGTPVSVRDDLALVCEAVGWAARGGPR